jgi:asparagine synthase (glutamine-hydrolysing)
MSAIAGIAYFDGKAVGPGQVEAMTTAMQHRGADGISHWRDRHVAIGQCMFRTTPESLEETQPLLNEDGSLVVVMDGRVDNFEELRRDLLGRGATLRDRSDAELVLKAYEIWGEQCPKHIIGECVFFIWDKRLQQFFAARDALGTRHFYYHKGQGWFAFASEIKGLLALKQIDERLNEVRLLDFLAVAFDRDDEVGTFYQDILRLPAGHAMTIGRLALRTWRYWDPTALSTSHYGSEAECREAFLSQFRQVIACRLRSIGSVGAMLSGGLDSSSIVGMVSKEFRGALNAPLKTYSLVQEDRASCQDWPYIEEMLKDQWLDPTLISSAKARDVSAPYFEDIGNANEPFTLTQGFVDSFVTAAARQSDCRVVMDGMAGDLLFYSMPASIGYAIRHRKLSHLPELLLAYRNHQAGHPPYTSMAKQAIQTLMPHALIRCGRSLMRVRSSRAMIADPAPDNLLGLLRPEVLNEYLSMKMDCLKEPSKTAAQCDQAAHGSKFTTGIISFAHEVIGQQALANGVEPRSPLSDRRMVEFAVQLPAVAKLSRRWYKNFLRETMVGVLPDKVRFRSTIGGHPGWRFVDQLSGTLLKEGSGFGAKDVAHERLSRWIDRAQYQQLCTDCDEESGYTARYKLLALHVLARWLSIRGLTTGRP